jgi:hypothetical protein
MQRTCPWNGPLHFLNWDGRLCNATKSGCRRTSLVEAKLARHVGPKLSDRDTTHVTLHCNDRIAHFESVRKHNSDPREAIVNSLSRSKVFVDDRSLCCFQRIEGQQKGQTKGVQMQNTTAWARNVMLQSRMCTRPVNFSFAVVMFFG